MLSLFGNEDYIYFRDPPSSWPGMRRGLLKLSTFSQSVFFLWAVSVSWIRWVCHCSLEKDKKDTNPRPGKATGWNRWLEALPLRRCLYNHQGDMSQGQLRQMFLERKLRILFTFTESLFCWVLLAHSWHCAFNFTGLALFLPAARSYWNLGGGIGLYIWSGDNQTSFLMTRVVMYRYF